MSIRLMDFITSVGCLRRDLTRRGFGQLADCFEGVPMTVEGAYVAAQLMGKMPLEARSSTLETARLMADLVVKDNPRRALGSVELAA